MPIAPILVGLLLVIGTIALALSGATWRWYHITLAALIMLLSTVWFYLAARTLKIEQAWRSEIANWETVDRQQDARRAQILAGGYTDPEGKDHPLSLDQLQTKNVERLQTRGRIWNNVVRKSVAPDGNMVVTVDKPDPAGIDKNMLVTVFDDTPFGPEGQLLGQFEVVDVKGKDVQLAPVLKLRPSELQRIVQARNAPLVMYEIMPVDTHEFMKIARDVAKDVLAKTPQEKEQIDKMDDAALIARLLPANIPDDVKQEYAKDGKPPVANEPHPERIWQRVKVVKEFTVPMSPEEIKAAQQQGEKPEVDPTTQQPVRKIAEGAILLLDPQTAAQRIAAGQVAPVPDGNLVYVRPLRDYQRLYRELNLQIEELLRSTAELSAQNEAVQAAQKKVTQDIAYRDDEKVRLGRDREHFQSENKLMKNQVAGLEKQLTLVKTEVENLLASNQQLEAELVMKVHAAVDKINRATQTVDANKP